MATKTEKRICKQCDTILSIYNEGEYCFVHQNSLGEGGYSETRGRPCKTERDERIVRLSKKVPKEELQELFNLSRRSIDRILLKEERLNG